VVAALAALLAWAATSRTRHIMFDTIRQLLWVKPLAICMLSGGLAFLAGWADELPWARHAPEVAPASVEALLNVLSSGMLAIAVFAVGSMISAYASASSTATPRAFPLILEDDVSQNALSTFVGAFIFGAVGLLFLKNREFGPAGLFALFGMTVAVFAIVIVSFLRWVDRIARLGRLGNTIEKVEAAAQALLAERRRNPTMCGAGIPSERAQGARPVQDTRIGYVQHVDMAALQAFAQAHEAHIELVCLPGSFVTPEQVLAYVEGAPPSVDLAPVAAAFLVGRERTLEDDPRFGLIVLSEIASRALSPAVNDPGTAIAIVGSLVRLLTPWGQPMPASEREAVRHDRVAVPRLQVGDLLDDAFGALARDAAGTVEVMIRLQKGLGTLAAVGDDAMREAATTLALRALRHAEQALRLPEEVEWVRQAAAPLLGLRPRASSSGSR
jgi:uncharacterized membrane protein